MGKRSDFPRRKNDAYFTWDPRVLPPLLSRLHGLRDFHEPCAGAGDLIDLLETAGMRCTGAWDILPQRVDIEVADASVAHLPPGVVPITNPPWTRRIMHSIIDNLARQGPAWFLFDADWAFTRQAGPLMRRCHEVVAVGRLRWVRDTDHDAQDNCAWYLFGPDAPQYPLFIGRD